MTKVKQKVVIGSISRGTYSGRVVVAKEWLGPRVAGSDVKMSNSWTMEEVHKKGT